MLLLLNQRPLALLRCLHLLIAERHGERAQDGAEFFVAFYPIGVHIELPCAEASDRRRNLRDRAANGQNDDQRPRNKSLN